MDLSDADAIEAEAGWLGFPWAVQEFGDELVGRGHFSRTIVRTLR